MQGSPAPAEAGPVMYLRGTDDTHNTSTPVNEEDGSGTNPTRKSSAESTSGATTLAPTPGNGNGTTVKDKSEHGKNSHSNGDSTDFDAHGDAGKSATTHRPTRPRALSTRYMTAEDLQELHRALSRRVTEDGSRSLSGESAYNPESDNFELETYMKRLFKNREEAGLLARSASVVFEDLCVDGLGSGVTYGETLGSTFLAPFKLLTGRKQPVKHILENFTGSVQPGEMLLVLGRPGSGCSSLLKTLANQTGSFSAISGEISYSGISPKEMAKRHTGDLAYLPEDDIHLPVLTVDQTL